MRNVQAIARNMVTASSPRSIGVIKRQVFQSFFQSLAEIRGRSAILNRENR